MFVGESFPFFSIGKPHMTDAFDAGNSLFVDEDFEGAVVEYTAAINGGFTEAQVYAKRAGAYINLEKFAEALQDSNKAIELDGSNDVFFLRKGYCSDIVSLFIPV
jgi:Flp pilus assembly protein TadD